MRTETYDYIEGTDYLDLESRKIRYIKEGHLKKFLENKKKDFEFQHEGALLVGYAKNKKIIIYYVRGKNKEQKKWD